MNFCESCLGMRGRVWAAWGSFDPPFWQSTMGIVHRHVGGPPLAPGGSDPFRFSAPTSLSQAICGAGFGDLHEETLAAMQPYVRGENIEFGASIVLASGSK